jgi:hypothetical protein
MVDANDGSAWSPSDNNAAPVLVLHRPTKRIEDPSAELAADKVRLKMGMSPRRGLTRLGVRVRVACDGSRTAEVGVRGKSAGSGMVGIVAMAAVDSTVRSVAYGNVEGNN